jgi:hypothetical protein
MEAIGPTRRPFSELGAVTALQILLFVDTALKITFPRRTLLSVACDNMVRLVELANLTCLVNQEHICLTPIISAYLL